MANRKSRPRKKALDFQPLEPRKLLAALADSPIAGRHVFFNNSFFDGDNAAASVADDNAIATDKVALLPGERATYENITNFDQGINGIIIDVDLANASAFSADDIVLSTGTGNQESSFSELTVTPEVSVRAGEGAGGTDRVTVILPSGSVVNEFLQIRVLANDTTGLPWDDVFYFGNAVGETGNSTTNTIVDDADISLAENNTSFFFLEGVDNRYDVNKDGLVNAVDIGIIENNRTPFISSLPLISTSAAEVPPVVEAPPVVEVPPPAEVPAAPEDPLPLPQPTGDQFLVSSESEIRNALNQAQPGDSIVLRNGTYTDFDIEFYADGEEGLPIIFRAETPGQVTLTGTSKLFISGDYLFVDGLNFEGGALERNDSVVEFRRRDNSGHATNSRFTNSAIINYNPDDQNTRYHWVRLYGQNNRVDNNTFSGQNHSGVTVVIIRDTPQADFHRIDNNHFLDRPEGNSNGFESIRLGESDQSLSDSFSIVENNLFERTDGEIEIISVKSGSNIIRNNTFIESAGTLTLRHGNNNLVEGNYFFGNGKNRSGGIRVIGEGHTIVNNYFEGLDGRSGGAISLSAGEVSPALNGHAQVRDLLIANNTIVNLNDGAAIEFSDSLGRTNSGGPRILLAENVTIVNNLISNSGETLIQGNEGSGFTYDNNIAFGSALGNVSDSSGFTAVNPQLTRSADGLLRLTANSPAIDAAFAQFASATGGIDIDGQVRGASFDIGADEFSTAVALDGPLDADDVGNSFDDFEAGSSPFAPPVTPPVIIPPVASSPGTPSPTTAIDSGLLVQAEDFADALDPNNDGDTFSVVSQSGAFGTVVEAPSGSRVSLPGTQDAVLTYNLQFEEAGTYTAYYRARGVSGSSDSFFTPTDFGATPEENESISNDGSFRYERGDSFRVSSSDLDSTLQFFVGKREAGAQLDAIVFHQDSNLSTSELDALFS